MVWGPSPSKAVFRSVNHLCRTSSEPGVAALDTVLSQRLLLFLTPPCGKRVCGGASTAMVPWMSSGLCLGPWP